MFGCRSLILNICITESLRPNHFLIFHNGSGVSRYLQLLSQTLEQCFESSNPCSNGRPVLLVSDGCPDKKGLSKKSNCENQLEKVRFFELQIALFRRNQVNVLSSTST